MGAGFEELTVRFPSYKSPDDIEGDAPHWVRCLVFGERGYNATASLRALRNASRGNLTRSVWAIAPLIDAFCNPDSDILEAHPKIANAMADDG